MGFGLPWSLLGSVAGGSAATFAALNLIGVFPVAQQGALGNGVHNDRPNIVATDAAAKAFGAVSTGGAIVYFHNPPDAFLTDQELVPSPGNRWVGEATARGQCAIRASAVMRSVVAVQSIHQDQVTGPTTLQLFGLSFDAASKATYAGLGYSSWLNDIDTCFFFGAKLDNLHLASLYQPLTLSAVTPGGGAPGGTTVSAPDPLYSGFSGSPLSAVAKIVTPGALGVATYQMSFDGGATFQAATQLIPASGLSNICLATGVTFSTGIGIQFHFPNVVFVAGWTFAFTATQVVPAGATGAGLINVESKYERCWFDTCGSIWTSPALHAGFGSFQTPTDVAGTVALAAGAQVIIGTGTSFLATGARPGDAIFISGIGTFPIACVQDDKHISILNGIANGNAITVAGATYAILVGANAWVDDNFVADNVRNLFRWCRFIQGPQHLRATGDATGTVTVDHCRFDNFYASFAIQLGGNQASKSGLLIGVEFKASTCPGAIPLFLGVNAAASVLEPAQDFVVSGPGDGFAIQNGTSIPFGGAASMVPLKADARITDLTVIAAAGQQIPSPSFNNPLGGSSTIHFTMAASFLMTATPFVTLPTPFNPNFGRRILLVNRDTTHTMTLQHDFGIGSNLFLEASRVAIGPGDAIELFQDFTGKVHQVAPVGRNYIGSGGAQARGSGSDVKETTPGSPTKVIYTMPAGIFLPGQQLTITLSARAVSNAGVNAYWSDIRFAFQDTNVGPMALLPGYPTVEVAGSVGAAAANWGYSGAIAGGTFSLTVDQGADAVNTVEWRVNVEHDAAPTQV